MTYRIWRTAMMPLLSLLLLTSLCLGQTATTGQLTGTVTDQSGAVITGAKVVLTNAAGIRREVATGASGDYTLTLIPPGSYSIAIDAKGFRSVTIRDVQVRITETTNLDAQLTVSATGESVEVTAESPLVQTTSATMGRVVETRSLAALPLATRNFTQILGLSTGAATYLPDNTSVGRNSQNISVNGSRVTWNNFQINGVDSNSMGTNSAPSLSIPAPETLEEFKVQTSMYDATYGRSAGGNVQAVTKSGTNNIHGNVYEYFRNNALNANDPFLKFAGVARPVLRRNVYGGTVGGPIKKDKAFFFASYQGTREANAASRINSQSSNILVAPGLTDDRSSATLLAKYGGSTTVLGTKVTSINPIALSLLNTKLPNGAYLIPTPNSPTGRFSGATPSIYHEEQFNTNIDYHFSDNNRLSAKFFYMNAPQTLVLPSFLGGGPNVPGFGNFQQNNGRIVSIQDTHIFSPTLFNEARIGYSFLRVDAFPQEPITDSSLGITRSNAAQQPGLGLIQIAPSAGGVVIGTSPTIDVKAVSPAATLYDAVSLIRGKHNIRIGGEFRYNQNNYNLNFFTRGQIQFNSFADFLAGIPLVSVYGAGDGHRRLIAPDYNFFVQDDWKVTHKLTLNLGLRYELDLPPHDTQGRIATFDPSLYKPTLVNPAGPPATGFVIAGNFKGNVPAGFTKVGDSVVKSVDPNNLAPRLGFAFSPLDNDKAVIRGGYGVFYSRSSFQYITLNVISPPTYVFGARVLPGSFSNPYFATPDPSAFPTLVPGVALSGQLFDRNLRTPYVHQYNLGLEYQFAPHTMIDIGYVGAHGLDLFRDVAINQAPLVAAGSSVTNPVTGAVINSNTPANAAARAPFQGTSVNGFFLNQTTAQSNYNSLQVSLNQRAWRGVQFLASYTYGKSIDNGSGQGGGAGSGGVLNPGSVGETTIVLGDQRNGFANRGVSDFDRTHRLVVSYLVDVPTPSFARDNNAGRAILGNWHLSGITTWMSGLPIDIVDNGAGSFYGLNGGSNTLARPNQVGDPFANVPSGYYFNPAAFQRPVVAAGQPIPSSGGAAVAGAIGTDLGTLGRNPIRGPRQSNFDFALLKNIPVRERTNVEFRADFFNLFNHVNYANPISDLNSVTGSGGSLDAAGKIVSAGSFGKIISASSNPRLVQFALKLNF